MKTDVDAIVALARKLRFEVSPAVRADFANFFAMHLAALAAIQAIDTTNIEPLTYIDPTPRTNWREDEVKAAMPRELVLNNAAQVFNQQIALPLSEGPVDD